jgi:hypothetical protein
MPLKTKAVKQRFLRPSSLTHHRADPPETTESEHRQQCKREFFNRILAEADVTTFTGHLSVRIASTANGMSQLAFDTFDVSRVQPDFFDHRVGWLRIMFGSSN